MSDKRILPFSTKDGYLLGAATTKAKLVWHIDYGNKRVARTRQLLLGVAEKKCQCDAGIAIRPFAADAVGERAARAVSAASRQGQFACMHRALELHDGEYSEEQLSAELGLNPPVKLRVTNPSPEPHSRFPINILRAAI